MKYLGEIYDGKWKVVDIGRYNKGKSRSVYYVLENIYNKQQVKVRCATFYKMIKGKTTMSKIIKMQIQMKVGCYEKRKD